MLSYEMAGLSLSVLVSCSLSSIRLAYGLCKLAVSVGLREVSLLIVVMLVPVPASMLTFRLPVWISSGFEYFSEFSCFTLPGLWSSGLVLSRGS